MKWPVSVPWRPSTGSRTAEGLQRTRDAKTTLGNQRAEMEQLRKMIRDLKSSARGLVERA